MIFEPNLELLECADRKNPEVSLFPYVAVFQAHGKTLVYMCDKHGANKSYDMIDLCFTTDKSPKPDVMLVEFENQGREFKSEHFNALSLSYAAVRAAKLNVPVVFADLSRAQMMDVLRQTSQDSEITDDILRDILQMNTNPDLSRALCNARDVFMLKNIAAAMNKYNVVWAIFGGAHYINQRRVLSDMFGEPKYVRDIPNMRMDCRDIEFTPIKLIDNESVKEV